MSSASIDKMACLPKLFQGASAERIANERPDPRVRRTIVASIPSSERVNLLNDRVFGCCKSLFVVDRSTIE
jgi:hypothetical protein